jgi:putative ABC transport system permease protein
VCEGLGKDPVIAQRQITPDYFEATRTPIRHGRAFTAADTAQSLPVVIVNETTARRYWPGADPIGKHLANSRDKVQREVVGVAADVKFRSLDAPNIEEMYLPLAQSPWPAMTVLVRSDADPRPLVAAVRQELARLDPDIAVSGVQSLDEIVSGSVAQPQLVERVVAVFAVLALVLASIGIYGVMSYSVAERTRELAVRMALGAGPREILRLVLGEGLGLTAAGLVLGLAVSLAATRLMSSLLFGVSATDPVTFGGAVAVLAATALLAAVRQELARLDPDIAVSGVQSLDEIVSGSVAQPQLVERVVAAFAVLAATALLASFLPARRGMRLSPVRALRDI